MANYKAQMLRLDNTKHNDIEVIVWCDDFKELKGLLEDPLYHIQHVLGPKWKKKDWAMIAPVTVIMSSDDAGYGNIGNPGVRTTDEPQDPPISINLVRSITGTDEKLKNGEWIALFSLNTHLVRVHYSLPEKIEATRMADRMTAAVDYTYTTPNIFYSVEVGKNGKATGRKLGTAHFDLTIMHPSEVNERRAIFVMSHLLDGEVCTCQKLGKRPHEHQAAAGSTPGSHLPLQHGTPATKDRRFCPHREMPIVIVEGLSIAATSSSANGGQPLVCTQSGCVWVENPAPGHWELDHMVVKNYVDPS